MARATVSNSAAPRVAASPPLRTISVVKAKAGARAGPEDTIEAPRWQRVSPLLALTIGFVAGSAFWHALGFWHFVGRAVFSDPPAVERVASPVDRPVALAAIDNCSTLIRDPVSGIVTTAICPPGSVEAWSGPALRRSDRVQALPPLGPPASDVKPVPTVAGWSAVTTEP